MSANVRDAEIVIVGGGPAGLCAAAMAAKQGAGVTLIERSRELGGQLLKQTHMFFGSQKQYASVRGIDIARILINELDAYKDRIQIMTDSTVLGLYEDNILTVESSKKYIKIRPQAIIAATGASEKFLRFPNNDLPGIYGAGAVQTLMNVYGVIPGNNVLMVGAGNIGLIVSYQLMQAGVRVKAIIDASPRIGGYMVHASKIRRMGIPIYSGYSVKYAYGTDRLDRITICRVDKDFNQIPSTDIHFDVDVCCISVGLTPLTELLWQIGCEMRYVPELGGHVPLRDADLKTDTENVYIAGDAAGIEEASSAMVEGRLAGLCAAKSIGYEAGDFAEQKNDCIEQLRDLRSGPTGAKTRNGIEKVITV